MSLPRVFHPVKPQDFVIRKLTVNKPFVVQRSDLYSGSLPQTGSGYRIWQGLYIGEKLKIGSSTYPTNSFDGSYKHVVWKSIDAQFYRFPYDTTATLEHSNRRFTYKFLNYSASIFSLPYLDYGESIKPGSVEITGSGFNLTDDKNGNLYDVSLNTGSYSDRYNLVGYWGFNNLFRKCKNIPHDFDKVKVEFESGIFDSEQGSVGRGISLREGVTFNSTASGMGCYFNGESYIHTYDRSEFNFTKDDDFTISFWVNYEPHGVDDATVISKNTIVTEQVYGLLDKYNQNDQVQKYYHVSSSTYRNPTPIYPYRFEIEATSNIMKFKRSDGIQTLTLSSSLDLDGAGWHHFATVKSGSNLYLYQDGTIVHSGSDVGYNPHNRHDIMFGADCFDLSKAYFGYVDEVRIYNKGLTSSTIQTLADSSSMGMYQTSIVGNVFYRSGNIVVSALNPKYNKIFENDFTFKYKGTHTIYDYETLIRIPKGSFNLTFNPSARKGPFSDLIIDEMTGSLANGALFPYATEIGLYSPKRELLAVAKLNQPLQMRDDTDINIIVNFHG